MAAFALHRMVSICFRDQTASKPELFSALALCDLIWYKQLVLIKYLVYFLLFSWEWSYYLRVHCQ